MRRSGPGLVLSLSSPHTTDVKSAELAAEYIARCEANWDLPSVSLQEKVIFCKSNGEWCRQGQIILRLGKDDLTAAKLAPQLKDVLLKMFLEFRSTGFQLQPCVTALTGASQEYRCYTQDGEIFTVLTTFFRKPKEALEETEAVEVVVTDLGRDLTRYPVGLVEHVRATYRAIEAGLGRTHPFQRIDCAVDSSGTIMTVEIEGGYDASTWPEFVRPTTDMHARLLGSVAAACVSPIRQLAARPH